MDLTEDVALSRFAAEGPSTLEGKGRVGVRTPDGQSSFSFRLAYDRDRGLRLDLSWKALAGIVRREGSVLVLGDSVWLDLPEDAEKEWGAAGGPSRIDLLGGLSPDELVLAILGVTGDISSRRRELTGFEPIPRKKTYLIVFGAQARAESLTVDASTGALLERVLDDGTLGRRLRVVYDRHVQIDGARRPSVVDVFDSTGPSRIRFVFSEQAVGRAQNPSRFEPGAGYRLLSGSRWGEAGNQAMGTFEPMRGY
jgi:hypothetical protein